MERYVEVFLDDQLKIYEAHLDDRSENGTIDQTAAESALLAEAYAKGTNNGVPVASDKAGYHDNAKYYKDQANSYQTAAQTAKTAAEAAQGGAEDAAEDAEAWAAGTRNGTSVPSTDGTYHNNAKYYSQQASSANTNAQTAKSAAQSAQTAAESAQTAAETAQGAAAGFAEDAEAWAVGQRDGTDVPSSDSAYHNNSKYYAEQAADAIQTVSAAETVAVKAKNDAVTAKTAAETAQGAAEAAQTAAENAQSAAETAEDHAETAQAAAEGAQTAAETAQGLAEDAQGYAETAQTAAEAAQSAAEGFSEDAEAWAVGQRGGTDVPSTDPTYENNSKYYAEIAAIEASYSNHPPYIGANGNWFVWNGTAYEDSNISSYGTPAAISGATASVVLDDPGTTPSVVVTSGGTPDNRSFDFDFTLPSGIDTNTPTDLTGVLAGNGTDVDVMTVDTAVTVGSNNLITSGAVADAVNAKPNPNLLDNWYFVGGGSQQGGGQFPINQRGQTSYSGGNYGVDRWAMSANVSVAVNAGDISASYSTVGHYLYQWINNPDQLLGKTITISGLVDGELATSTMTFPSSYTDGNVGTVAYFTSKLGILFQYNSNKLRFMLYAFTGTATNTAFHIKAFKAEFGTSQTLAHNEGTSANPVWVLNKIPDYGTELIRCISSRADSSDTYSNIATAQAIQDAAAAPNANGFHPLTTVDSAPAAANTDHLISSAAVWAATEGYGLGKTAPTLVTNYDTVTKNGFYYAAYTATGAPPVTATCVFIHINYPVSGGNSAVQIASSTGANQLFARWERANVWTAWKPILPNIVYLSGRSISVANNAQIARIPTTGTNQLITTDSVVLSCVFANPEAIVSNATWTSYDGYIVFTGTCTSATTANITIAY